MRTRTHCGLVVAACIIVIHRLPRHVRHFSCRVLVLSDHPARKLIDILQAPILPGIALVAQPPACGRTGKGGGPEGGVGDVASTPSCVLAGKAAALWMAGTRQLVKNRREPTADRLAQRYAPTHAYTQTSSQLLLNHVLPQVVKGRSALSPQLPGGPPLHQALPLRLPQLPACMGRRAKGRSSPAVQPACRASLKARRQQARLSQNGKGLRCCGQSPAAPPRHHYSPGKPISARPSSSSACRSPTRERCSTAAVTTWCSAVWAAASKAASPSFAPSACRQR